MRKGRSPDSELIRLVELLFSDYVIDKASTYLSDNNPISHAITGIRNVDLWRAWREAYQSYVQGNPLEANTKLKNAAVLYPLSRDGHGLPDLEIDALTAKYLAEGNRPLDAYNVSRDVKDRFLRFVSLIQSNPHVAANEIRTMLAELSGAIRIRSDLTDEDLISAWALGRGLSLLLDNSLLMVNLLLTMGRLDDIRKLMDNTKTDILSFHSSIGCAFDLDRLVKVEFTFGNCWTETDPAQALSHFDAVVRLSGLESGTGLNAAVNSANCLTRLHRFAEARSSYSTLESLFEERGDYLSAARVWAAECNAEWHETGNSSVVHSLVGAIKMFEESLSPSSDHKTLYMQKKYIDPGYKLLISILSDCEDRSDDDLNELLSASWALLSIDFRANLKPDNAETVWMKILESERRPLSIAKKALAPFHGTAVVHVFLVPSRLEAKDYAGIPPSLQAFRLVWIIYGYDRSGRFRFETSVNRPEHSVDIVKFLNTMEEQLSADMRRDPIQVQYIGIELVRLSEQISSYFSSNFIETLLGMDHLYYMPHPYYSIDEFPLNALRFNGQWLGIRCNITRSPSLNHLREILNPNRPRFQTNNRAVIVTGEPSGEVHRLQDTSNEVERVNHMLKVYGFDCEHNDKVRSLDMMTMLDGGAGVVHYIGHGIASNIYEWLPLPSGEMFEVWNIDRLTGARTGFVFLCACEAARIRHGAGGYQTGIASKLSERGSPGVISFSMSIPETRAYEIVRVFYRQAFLDRFGTAVRESQKHLSVTVPTYAWLALSAYGDPEFLLPSMVRNKHVRSSANKAVTWDSQLRSYAVLRTEDDRRSISKMIHLIPNPLRLLVNRLITYAFLEPPSRNDNALNNLEKQALNIQGDFDAELLSLGATICLERAHRIGLDATPVSWPRSADVTRRMVYELRFVASVGVTLFDTRLNGLGCALMGRLITWDQGNVKYSKVFLQEAVNKLRECVSLSSYVRRIVDETFLIAQQFGENIL